ncbi:metal-dependent transcriptional regulator [Planktosalinus lacus]|uniref:Transcriptional regulator MntR n=1 Tax=Planktosalinus lacus TaxID=1526573 RepID=A0A8J2YBB8_9FLAO|nr:metal-dependent transcriptional regulator [Planktosalinus lacus]GGD94878.1 iron-dependent repressor [Planktosalinus lacus]
MFSDSEENYLKAIFHLQRFASDGVSTNAIAEQMHTKASSVTDMLKKLSDKKLVNYVKYQGVTLTNEGKKTAAKIIRKHRLWEVFLVEKLDFSWDEVHEIAEQLEHIESDVLIEKLDKHLDFPKFDPHGDPIPSKDGTFPERDKVLLSEIKVGESGVCVGVKDTSSSFLKFLDKNGVALGKKIKVLEHEEFDDSMRIQIGKESMTISHMIASNLYLKTN